MVVVAGTVVVVVVVVVVVAVSFCRTQLPWISYPSRRLLDAAWSAARLVYHCGLLVPSSAARCASPVCISTYPFACAMDLYPRLHVAVACPACVIVYALSIPVSVVTYRRDGVDPAGILSLWVVSWKAEVTSVDGTHTSHGVE